MQLRDAAIGKQRNGRRQNPRYAALVMIALPRFPMLVYRLMKKQGGERYARTMLTDLERRGDRSSARLAVGLTAMLADPDFREDWD